MVMHTTEKTRTCRCWKTEVSASVKEFNQFVVESFGKQYLNRCPTEEEKIQILARNKAKGFLGLFASWDCKHYP
jgi:hypothetical protein